MENQITVREAHKLRIEAERKIKEIAAEFLSAIAGNNLEVGFDIRPTYFDPDPLQIEFEIDLKVRYD